LILVKLKEYEMKWHNILTTGPLSHLCGLVIGAALCASSITATAQTTSKVTGELTMGRSATVNGQPATAGLTLFNNNRVKTAKQGLAALNLGKQGRIELGADTDLSLRLTPGMIGGQMTSGRMLVNIPAGVGLAVSTGKSTVLTDGKLASTVLIETTAENVRVVAHRGEAMVATGGKSERVTAGEEVSLNDGGREGFKHRRAVIGGTAAGAGVVAGVLTAAGSAAAPAAASAAAQTSTFSGLLTAGVRYSAAQVGGGVNNQFRDPDSFFSINPTCRDSSSILCRRRSPVKP
jgi:hypothetical protein